MQLHTLADLIDADGSNGIPEAVVAAFAHDLLRGLQALHANGFLHRSLSPK
jgi:serine/threonine protein kinase